MADTLPVGYRFCPSDEQLFSYCLARKVKGDLVLPEFIYEFNVYEKEPWEFFGENAEESFYLFTKLNMKKSRAVRTAGSGYWKGVKTTDIRDRRGYVVGHKKHFNFKVKDASPSGNNNAEKGSWIMHEYSILKQEIVLCKIRFKKEESGRKQGTTLFLSTPIRIGDHHPLKDSSDMSTNVGVPHQDINMEPSKATSLFLDTHAEWQPLYVTDPKRDALALSSHPLLPTSAQPVSVLEDFVSISRPIEQSFADNATSDGTAGLPASTTMEENINGVDFDRLLDNIVSFDWTNGYKDFENSVILGGSHFTK